MPVNAWGQIYIGSSAPQEDPVQVGSLWTDTVNNLLKRCTSISPYTWVSTEGGSSAHTLDSGTHTGVAAMTEAKGMLIAHDGANWVGLSVGANGQQLEADSAAALGVKWAAAGGSFGGAGYPVDVEATEADGTATTLARSDHQHKLGVMTTRGDLVRRGAAAAERLALGTTGQQLLSDGADAIWADSFIELLITGSAATWTNMPAAETELGGGTNNRLIAELLRFTEYRLTVQVVAAGTAGADFNVEYSTDNVTFNDLNATAGQGEVTVGATGLKAGAWTAMAAGAKANDIYLRVVGKDGDGVVDPQFAKITVQFRS